MATNKTKKATSVSDKIVVSLTIKKNPEWEKQFLVVKREAEKLSKIEAVIIS